VRDYFGRDPHKGVNPDEVVAVGAAVQGGVLAGEVKDVLLLDVTPLSLGIETLGGVMTTLIQRNSTIPTRKSEVFSTAADNQPAVDVHVLQGERPMARDNRTLGRFHLEGIMPAPRGVPKIEVTFDIDANGILNVAAKDQATGRDQKIVITASSGLNENDIQRMVKEAQEHEGEDKRRREDIETRNKADAMVYQMEKMLAENKDKLGEGDAATLEARIKDVKDALAKEDFAAIKTSMEALQQASYKAAEVMYRTAGPAAGPEAAAEPAPGGAEPGAAGPGGNGKGVIDAEFEEAK
jgi:molecular chaperone DnaK